MTKQYMLSSVALSILVTLLVLSSFIPNGQSGIYDPFHTKEEKIAMWKTLWDAHPDAEYISVGKTYSGADIWLFTVGNPSGGRVLWDGELHGNEDKGSEILFLMAKWLLESGDPQATAILEENYVMFIPVVNSNYERGNGDTEISPFGVDLNRNFKTGWQSSNPSDDTYGGPFALSEPETRVMRSVFSNYKPTFYVNLHAGGGPYAAYYDRSNATLTSQVLSRTNAIAKESGVVPYRTISLSSHGYTIGDAVSLGVKSAWIIETVGRSTAWEHLQQNYNELVNVYYPKCLAIFIAMCEASVSTNLSNSDLPRIQTITQSPSQNDVHVYDAVQVYVTLSNNTFGIRRASLDCIIDDEEPFTVNMTKIGNNIWSGQIPPYPSIGNLTYTVTAENMAGGVATSEAFIFSYKHAVPLEIHAINQYPSRSDVRVNDVITVYATLANNTGAIRRVNLNYASDNGALFEVNMTEIRKNVWSGHILPLALGRNVTYTVTVENDAGDTVTSLPINYTYSYTPESAVFVAIFIVMLLSLLIIRLSKRNR